MNKEQTLQEKLYKFPYHYIPIYINGKYSQSIRLSWGYVYLSRLFKIIEVIKGLSFESLIDIGCGDGRLLYELRKDIKEQELVGLDYSEQALAFAKAFNQDVEFLCVDILDDQTHTEKTYDVVTLVEVVEHLDPERLPFFLHKVKSLLNPHGRLVISVPSTNIPVSPKHFQHFDLELLDSYLSNDYSIDEIFYINKKLSKTAMFLVKLVQNRHYQITNSTLLSFLFNVYQKKYLTASAETCSGILVICSLKGFLDSTNKCNFDGQKR